MENLLSEAFQRLSLLENDFDFSTVDKDKVDELSAFISDDVEVVPEEPIIDVNANDESELADSYVGKVILECECCHTRIYKDEAEVVIDDETGSANIDEACPVCNNSLGYTVIGKIEAFDSNRNIEPEEDVEEDDVEEPVEEPEEEEVDEVEDEEEKDESLKNQPLASEDSKKLDEAADKKYKLSYDKYYSLARKLIDFIVKNNKESNVVKLYNKTEQEVRDENPKESESNIKDICQEVIIDKYWGSKLENLFNKYFNIKLEYNKNAEDDQWFVTFNGPYGKFKLTEAQLPLADRIARKHFDSLLADESLKNQPLASEDSKKLDEGCDCEEAVDGSYDTTFDRDFDAAVDELDELPPDDLPDPWGANLHRVDTRKNAILGKGDDNGVDEYDVNESMNNFDKSALAEVERTYSYSENMEDTLEDTKEAAYDTFFIAGGENLDDCKSRIDVIVELAWDKAQKGELDHDPDEYDEFDESLTESVEVHADNEAAVDIVKNDDGSVSVNVGPEEATAESAEEIVPLTAEDEASIEANEPEEDEFAEEPVEEPFEDEFEEEPIEDEAEPEEEEEPFESLEGQNKPSINEAKESGLNDQIEKEQLKQMKIKTKMMKMDLEAKKAEMAPAVEEPIEEPIEEPEEDVLESITDMDDTAFNTICESYLKRVYSNVESFKTSKVLTGVNKAVVEGIITFTSGKSKNTVFNFANPTITKRGKLVMEGFNKTFSNSNEAFTLKMRIDNTNLIAESMVYNYTSTQLNESNKQKVVRVYGRVKA